jgi:hypothetical protein
MIRFYDGADGQVGTLLSTQDVFTFTETEYYNTSIPPIGIVRGYHYTLDLASSVTIPSAGQYWISITAILDRACDPDVNQDGNVDQDDVSYLINVVGGGENPTGIDPDFNQDGNVDQDDIAALINTVGGGGCP